MNREGHALEWRMAVRWLWRDLRGGRLGLLAAALVVAVAAVTAVGWLAERVGAATTDRAAELIAADRLVRTDEPVPEAWIAEARDRGLETARTVEFPSVALAGERSRLVSFKAVESGYPLRGRLRVAAERDGTEEEVRRIPERGTAWVEPRLLNLLGIEVGDALQVGEQSFEIRRVILAEPDRGAVFASLAPRVMLHWDDVEGTGLVREGARVRYALLLGGPEEVLDAYGDWVLERDERDAEVRGPQEGQPAVREVVRQAERFLGLAALITVVVAAAAILLTARHYAAAQLDRVAVMRVLGASQGRILRLQSLVLLLVALAAGAVGAGVGFGVHLLMIGALTDVLPPDLAGPSVAPAGAGLLLGVIAAAGFALPTAARLRHVPPMRVLRRSADGGLLQGTWPYVVAAVVIAALMAHRAQDLQLAAVVIGAVAVTLGVLAAAAWLGVRLAAWLRHRAGSRLLWLTGVARRPGATVVQVVAVGLGLMALLLLSAVREDLLDTWQAAIPDEAPDTFLINVQEDEVEPLRELLAEMADTRPTLYPLARGRLDAINGRGVDLDEDFGHSPRTRRTFARDLNLTWAGEPPPDNEIVAGEWWGDDPGAEWSMEADLARRAGIYVGDELTFIVDGRPVTGTVTSLREVRWDSFNPNFFVIGAPGLIDARYPEYITSFRLGDAAPEVMPRLVDEFPGVTPVDVGTILSTVRSIVGQGARVVELMAGLTLIAGVVVLLAALRTAAAERRFEASLLRALGASRRRLEAMAVGELAASGALAGVLAGGAAAAGGYFAAQQLFDLAYPFPTFIVLLGAVLGAVVVAGAGWLGARADWRVSPMALLRAGE